MSKLVRANLFRLKKDKIFIICIVTMCVFGAISAFNAYDQGDESVFENAFFNFVIAALLLCSAFIPLFIGTDYDNGTLRNKLILGHSRTQVYMANFTVCVYAMFMMCLSYIIIYIPIAKILIGKLTENPTKVCILICVSFAILIALCAIMVMISQCVSKKAYSAVICLVMVFLMLISAVIIRSSLDEPEYYDAYSYTQNGVTVLESRDKNSNYLSGNKRKVYEFAYDFTIGGQTLQIFEEEMSDTFKLCVYDAVKVVAFTCAGLICFKRKDLK